MILSKSHVDDIRCIVHGIAMNSTTDFEDGLHPRYQLWGVHYAARAFYKTLLDKDL